MCNFLYNVVNCQSPSLQAMEESIKLYNLLVKIHRSLVWRNSKYVAAGTFILLVKIHWSTKSRWQQKLVVCLRRSTGAWSKKTGRRWQQELVV